MKKSLSTVAALSALIFADAQILTNVDSSALFYVGEGALVYNGGGVQTKGSGIIDIHGDVMVVGSGSDEFRTKDASGNNLTSAGDNIILRMNDLTEYKSYGQLYITGVPQANITGFVTKEYLSTKHGSYQQVGLPFYKKPLTTLSTELSPAGALTDRRWTTTEVLNWDNRNIVSASIPLAASTTDSGNNAFGLPFTTKPNSYYMVGTARWNPESATTAATVLPSGATSYNVYNVKGMPSADGIVETLKDAGLDIDYGTNGNNRNGYTELYNTYLGDPWAVAKGESWTGNFGRNIYQFGNPFLTNLDLSQIVGADGATMGDGNDIANLIGIRYNDTGVVFDRVNGTTTTTATTPYVVTFASGNPVGDQVPVIKPMGFFVLKLNDNTGPTLNFDTLRRFKSTNRAAGTDYSVTAAKMSGNQTAGSGRLASGNVVGLNAKTGSSFVKQIGLVALDAAGKEIGRTYYAVYPTAESGFSTNNTTQSAASSSHVIGTFEEAKSGGIDSSLQNSYWLYINVANDKDFKGKAIPAKVYSSEVKSIKIELKEDGKLVADNTSKLSSGESFYVGFGNDAAKSVAHGQTIALAGNDINIFYGSPTDPGTLGTANVNKPSETVVVYDKNSSKYVVLFDRTWKTADVAVYDLSGKMISTAAKVNAENAYTIELPNITAGYVVTAVSESGAKFVQKIKK